MYSIIYKKKAKKNVLSLPVKQQKRVLNAIRALAMNPFIGKKLTGEYEGLYSLRAVPYRIIYTIYKKEIQVVIINIGHRKDVYKK